MNLKKILDELKVKTVSESDFAKSFDYFLTHIGENETAMHASIALQDKTGFFNTLIQDILNRAKLDLQVKTLALLGLENKTLIHGSGFLSNNQVCALYFLPEIGSGILMLTRANNKTDFFRISTFVSEKPITSTPHTHTNKTKH